MQCDSVWKCTVAEKRTAGLNDKCWTTKERKLPGPKILWWFKCTSGSPPLFHLFWVLSLFNCTQSSEYNITKRAHGKIFNPTEIKKICIFKTIQKKVKKGCANYCLLQSQYFMSDVWKPKCVSLRRPQLHSFLHPGEREMFSLSC